MGSLAKTGCGHRTDYAIRQTFGKIPVKIIFDSETKELPHSNTMRIKAFSEENVIYDKMFLSVGGGAIEVLGEEKKILNTVYAESTFAEVEAVCEKNGISLAEYVKVCEGSEIIEYIKLVWKRMKQTAENGLRAEGIIPGGLGIKRKAARLFKKGQSKAFGHEKEIYLISAYAYAVSEENASGGMMVTAPTCGASGVLPAVLIFKQQELGFSDDEIISALLTAGIVGNIIKHNASMYETGKDLSCRYRETSEGGLASLYGSDL